MSRVSPQERERIDREIAALSPRERIRLATLAFGAGNEVVRWAELLFVNPSDGSAYARLRPRGDDPSTDALEQTIDDSALDRGLRRAIVSAAEHFEVPFERSLAGHLDIARDEDGESDPDDVAIASRIIQFACFDTETERYYTGAGIES